MKTKRSKKFNLAITTLALAVVFCCIFAVSNSLYNFLYQGEIAKINSEYSEDFASTTPAIDTSQVEGAEPVTKTEPLVTVESNIGEGMVSVDNSNPNVGDEVTISVNEKYGYQLRDIEVKDEKGESIELHPIGGEDIKHYIINIPEGGAKVHAYYYASADSTNNAVKNYSGKMYWKDDNNVSFGEACNVDCNWGFDLLTKGDNTQYNKDLCLTSLLLSNSAYYRAGNDAALNKSKVIFNDCVYNSDSPDYDIYKNFGFLDVTRYDITSDDKINEKDDVTTIYLAYRPVKLEDNSIVNVYSCVVRGTNGTLSEWCSNFDVGTKAKASDIKYPYANASHWVNSENHKGFDVCAELVMQKLSAYVQTHNADSEKGIGATKNYILVSGHSRGASIANLVGSKIVDSSSLDNSIFSNFTPFTYTFASPNTTTSNQFSNPKYNSIWNIVNTDDVVPAMPYNCWGFKVYGNVLKSKVSDTSLEPLLESSVGWIDYWCPGSLMSDLNNYAKQVAKNRDDLYRIPNDNEWAEGRCCCYELWYDLTERQEAINKSEFGDYCETRIIERSILPDTLFVKPSPAFLMRYLAHLASDSIFLVNKPNWLEIDGVYNDFRNTFVKCGIGYAMSDPHYLCTYYTICQYGL